MKLKVQSYALECSEVKVKVTQNKTTPVKYRYLKNVLKYSNEVVVLRYWPPLILSHKSTIQIWILHVLCVSVWMNGADAVSFTHIPKWHLNIWLHKPMNIISRAALRVILWAFDHFFWVQLSSYHIQTETSQQPVKIKVLFNLKKLWPKHIN